MTILWKTLLIVAGSELTIALLLMLLPRIGRPGRALSAAMTRAPLLDVVVAIFTWVPGVAAVAIAGWIALPVALVGQVLALFLWIAIHELVHRPAARGPRLIKAHRRLLGRWRNQAALWLTAVVIPVFWLVRFGEILLYPPLRWLTRFPRYRQGEWISVSRHKFDGLVGHDLIWCLYCDWMTGVYALAGEMLRNVESFWCPIRFDDSKKCDHCMIDFPDIDDGWVAADGSMADAEALVLRKYSGDTRGWFGHRARLTVNGAPVEDP